MDTNNRCKSCAFFVPKSPGASVYAGTGECRAEPPVTSYRWPQTREEEYCGRWCSRENPAPIANKKKRQAASVVIPEPMLPAPEVVAAAETELVQPVLPDVIPTTV